MKEAATYNITKIDNPLLTAIEMTALNCYIQTPSFSRSFKILHKEDLHQAIMFMGIMRVIKTTQQADAMFNAYCVNMYPNMAAIMERVPKKTGNAPTGLKYVKKKDMPMCMHLAGARMPDVASYREAFLQMLDLHEYEEVTLDQSAHLLDQVRSADLPMERPTIMLHISLI